MLLFYEPLAGLLLLPITIIPSPAIATASAQDPIVVGGSQTIEPGPAIVLALGLDPSVVLTDFIFPATAIAFASAERPTIVISDPGVGSPPSGGGLTIDPLPAIAFGQASDPLVNTSSFVVTPGPASASAQAIDPTIRIGQSFSFLNANTPVKGIRYRFDIEGYGVLTNYQGDESPPVDGTPWIVEIEPFRKSINDLEGNATMGDLVVIVLDKDRAVTADFPGFLFEGKPVILKVGLDGLHPDDYETLFAGFVDRVETGEKALSWRIVCKDRGILLRKTVYLTGDDGQPISSEHPRTVAGHPLDILLEVLETEVALDLSFIDYNSIFGYRDNVFPGMRFEFSLTNAVEAKQFIEQELLRPLGGWLHMLRTGLLAVRFFQALTRDVVHALDEHNVVSIPELEQLELINALSHRYDLDTDTPHETVTKDAASVTKYGLESLNVIDSAGMRAAAGAATISRTVAGFLFQRYADKAPKITLLTFWTAVFVETGEFVTLSHPLLPDRETGAMGLSGTFEVIARTWYFKEGRVELVLIGTDLCIQYHIHPGDASQTWTFATQAERDRYMFIADDVTGNYCVTSVPGNTLA